MKNRDQAQEDVDEEDGSSDEDLDSSIEDQASGEPSESP